MRFLSDNSPWLILAGVALVAMAVVGWPSPLLCGIALASLGAAGRLAGAFGASPLLLAVNAGPYLVVFLFAAGGAFDRHAASGWVLVDAVAGAALLALHLPIVRRARG